MTRGSPTQTLLQLRLVGVSLEYSGDAASVGAVLDGARASFAAARDAALPSLLESRDAPSLEYLSDTSSTSISDAARLTTAFDEWFRTVPASGHCQRRIFMLTLRAPRSCRLLRVEGHVLALCRACSMRAFWEAT